MNPLVQHSNTFAAAYVWRSRVCSSRVSNVLADLVASSHGLLSRVGRQSVPVQAVRLRALQGCCRCTQFVAQDTPQSASLRIMARHITYNSSLWMFTNGTWSRTLSLSIFLQSTCLRSVYVGFEAGSLAKCGMQTA